MPAILEPPEETLISDTHRPRSFTRRLLVSVARFLAVLALGAMAGGGWYLAKKGFDPLMGARPMARLIQDTIRRALADELLFGRLQHGGKVAIDIGDDDNIKLAFEEEPAPVA